MKASTGQIGKNLVVVVIVLATLALAAPVPANDLPKMLIEEGPPSTAVYVAGLIRLYDQTIQANPKDLNLRKRFILFLENAGQISRATSESQNLIKEVPNDAELGLTLERLIKVSASQQTP